MSTPSPGAVELKRLSALGFSDQEIQDHIATTNARLSSLGFSEDEVRAHWGAPPVPDDSDLRAHFAATLAPPQPAEGEAPGKPSEATTLKQAFDAGFLGSSGGLALVRREEAQAAPVLPDDPSMPMRLAAQAGSLLGDAPAMVAGYVLGGANPITGGGGSFALPAAIRSLLVAKYERGEVTSFREFYDRATAALVEAFKGYAVGAATGGAGKAVGALSPNVALRIGAEIPTMVTVGAALDGRVPEPHEFVDGLLLVGALHGAGWAAGRVGPVTERWGAPERVAKLLRVYERTGLGPREVVAETRLDPSIAEDLASKNLETPRALRTAEAVEAQAAGAAPTEAAAKAARVEAEAAKLGWTQGGAGVAAPPPQPPPSAAGSTSPPPPGPPTAAPAAGGAPPTTPRDRILSKLSIDQPSPRTPYTWSDLYTDLFDRYHPVYRDVRSMWEATRKTGQLPTEADPYKLLRMAVSIPARADHFLRFGTVDYTTDAVTGPSLQSILEPLRAGHIDPNDLRSYLVSRRAIELSQRPDPVATPFDLADAQAEVARLDAQLRPVADQLYRYQQALLDGLEQSGILDAAQRQRMEAANRFYVPFNKLVEPETPGGGGKGADLRNPLKKIRGNQDLLQIDPLESIVRNTYTLVSVAERNRIARGYVELAEQAPNGSDFATRVAQRGRPIELSDREKAELVDQVLGQGTAATLSPAEQAALAQTFAIFRRLNEPLRQNQIALFRAGQREVWQVEPRTYEAFQGMERHQAGLFVQMMKWAASFQRAGITLTPEFALRNPVRDFLTSAIYAGSHPLNTLRGLYELANQGPRYQEWLRSGAPISSLVSFDRDYLQSNIREMLSDGTLSASARNVFFDALGRDPRANAERARWTVTHPLAAMRVLSEFLETTNRMGVFERARRRGASIREAGFQAREGTLDFNRMGRRMHDASAVVAFFNPSVQGLDRFARELKANPVRLTARATAWITVPTVLSFLHNRESKDYWEIPQWQRDLFWIVRAGDGPDSVFARIPVPQEMLPLKVLTERVMADIVAHDPKAFDGFLESASRATVPNVIPTALVPIIEAMTNHSLFMDKPIVPRSMEQLLPELQAQPYTTELAKAIGRLVADLPGQRFSEAASPLMIENAVRGWGGGVGVYALQLANRALTAAGALPERVDPEETWADVPLVKGFVVRYPTAGGESLSRFQERYRQETTVKESLAQLQKWAVQGDTDAAVQLQRLLADPSTGLPIVPEGIHQAISQQMAMVRAIARNQLLSPSDKRQLSDRLMLSMSAMARTGNELFDRIDARRGELEGSIEERRSRAEEPPILRTTPLGVSRRRMPATAAEAPRIQ